MKSMALWEVSNTCCRNKTNKKMNNFVFKSLHEKHGTLGTVSNTSCRNTNNNKIILSFFKSHADCDILETISDTGCRIFILKIGTFRTIINTCHTNFTKKKRKIIPWRLGHFVKNLRHLLQDFVFGLFYTQPVTRFCFWFVLHTVWPFRSNLRHLLQKQ